MKLANEERTVSKERDRLNRELQMVKATGREEDPLQELERKLEDARDVSLTPLQPMGDVCVRYMNRTARAAVQEWRIVGTSGMDGCDQLV